MSEDSAFEELMARLRLRDNDAAAEVFNRFASRLCALARSNLDCRIRQKVDPEDVLLSAYKSFFARQADGRLDATSWEGLWAILTVITVGKCRDHVGFFHAAKRDTRREVLAAPPGKEAGEWLSAIDREPSPLEALTLAETVQALMSSLETHEQEILGLSLQGYSTQEISAQCGRAERTVQRVRERVKKRLERMAREE